jgi:hypothetical protein
MVKLTFTILSVVSLVGFTIFCVGGPSIVSPPSHPLYCALANFGGFSLVFAILAAAWKEK